MTTERRSSVLSGLSKWRVGDDPFATKAELITVATALEAPLQQTLKTNNPEALKAFAVFSAQLLEFGRAFGIPIANPDVLIGIYKRDLADIPAALFQPALEAVTGNWRWGNRMPMPADIRAAISKQRQERESQVARARVAALYAPQSLKSTLPKDRVSPDMFKKFVDSFCAKEKK